MSDRFISTVMDGTFHPIGVNEDAIERDYNAMPFYESNGREL